MTYRIQEFTAASQLLADPRARALVRSQPGYRRGATMRVMPMRTGARLYVRVDGRWMDASLADMPGVGVAADGGLYTFRVVR